MKAHDAAAKLELELESSLGTYTNWGDLTERELIEQLSIECVTEFNNELFIFTDNSCITRDGKSYFIYLNYQVLSQDYLNKFKL